MTTQDFRTVPGIVFLQREFGAQGREDIATAGMPDPAGDILFPQFGSIEHRAGMSSGQSGNLGGQKIAEKTAPVIEAEVVTVFWSQMGGRFDPSNRPWPGEGIFGKDGGGGAIAKKAGTDQDAGIVIQVGGGGADFHADHEGIPGLTRRDQGGGLLEGWQSSSTT
jgi:hypothetical protein